MTVALKYSSVFYDAIPNCPFSNNFKILTFSIVIYFSYIPECEYEYSMISKKN